MKKTPNPVIKLLFQVCFSPHERAALAILLIKTHITMSRLSPRPRSPELGSAGSPGHKTGGKRQTGTVTLYSTPGIPDSGYTTVTAPSHPPSRRNGTGATKWCWTGTIVQPSANLVLMEMHFAELPDWTLVPTMFYRAQHKPNLGNLFSLEFSPPSTAIIESQNHRIIWVGRDKDHPVQLLRPMKGQWGGFYKSWSLH